MSLTTKDLLILSAIIEILEKEYGGVTLEELGCDSEDKQKKIIDLIENNEAFARKDDVGFIKEELISIFKEIVDKVE